MKMIIGGAYQGKKAFAMHKFGIEEENIVSGGDASLEDILHAQAVADFHLFIAQCLKEDKDPAKIAEILIDERPDLIIISNEVGYGIVPIDAFERRWREAVGRTSTTLAAASSQVWRVACGIGTCIKGE